MTLRSLALSWAIAVSPLFAQSDFVVVLQVNVAETDASPVISIRDRQRARLEFQDYGTFEFRPTVDNRNTSRVMVEIYGPRSEEPFATVEVVEGDVAVATATSPRLELSALRVYRLE